MTTTTETIIRTGEFADHERATTPASKRGAGRAVLSSTAYTLRQLAGAWAIIALVWLAVMLYKHVQPVALALAGVLLVGGSVALFLRNRSLSRAEQG